jgi:subtilisin family serine protease
MEARSELEPALLAMLDDDDPRSLQAPETVSVTVKYTGAVAELEAVGFAAWTVIPNPSGGPSIAAGPIPRNRLGDLADLPGVLYVEGSRPHRAELKDTVPEIQADLVHSGNPSRKGAGVIVGIIDSGIDFTHRSFRTPDDTTRVLGIWDQTLLPMIVLRGTTTSGAATITGLSQTSDLTVGMNVTGTGVGVGAMINSIDSSSQVTLSVNSSASGTVAITFVGSEHAPAAFPTVGVEYSQADIDATLRNAEDSAPFPAGTTKVRSVDRDGHGTHVAGIAAGDGSQNGNCRGSGVFVGVAPLADLLIVKVASADNGIGESQNLLHAFDWIWNHPAVVGNAAATPPVPARPVVVNLSRGDSRGPHDGTSLVESGLDLFLLQHRGHAVVKSAGNEGDTNRHAHLVLPPNATQDVTFEVGANDTSDRHIEMWFSKDDDVRVTLRGPVPVGGGARPASGSIGGNSGPVPFVFRPAPRQVTATINSRVNDPRNGACVIEIDLTRPGGVPLLDGEWQIHLENTFNRAATVDLYIERGEGAPRFTSHATRDGSLTIPGTAQMVVTVGAYAPQTSFLFFDSDGDLTDFSSFGPTRDGRPKPDVCAPGSKVTSVKTKTRQHCCCNCCADFYTDNPGEDSDVQRTSTVDEHAEGTSLAAPHVAGTIALMFEKDPTLHVLDVLKILRDTAREPEVGHGALPDSKWGAGRVSALGAVNGIPGPVPIPGPTPPVPGPAGPGGGLVPGGGGGPIARIGLGRPLATDDRAVHDGVAATAGGSLGIPIVWSGAGGEVLQTPAGQYWAAVVSRHFSEVRGLINNNRRVATCWHRMDGPRLLSTLGPALSGIGVLAIRDDRDGLAAWRPRLGRFLDMLERFGSPPLVADVRTHRELLLTVEVEDVLDLAFERSAA